MAALAGDADSKRVCLERRRGLRPHWHAGLGGQRNAGQKADAHSERLEYPESFAWFEKLGWKKAWDWGEPPTFGGVCSGECEIFLCQNGQGGRGKSSFSATFGPESDETAETAVWMSIWVDDVDEIHHRCVEQGLDVTWPPTDMPWNAREMHVRHPDGHVFRISRGVDEAE